MAATRVGNALMKWLNISQLTHQQRRIHVILFQKACSSSTLPLSRQIPQQLKQRAFPTSTCYCKSSESPKKSGGRNEREHSTVSKTVSEAEGDEVVYDSAEAVEEEDLGDFSRNGLSPEIQQRLKRKGIETLFPVQYETLGPTIEGRDLIVQARTGTGKTLSFAIPLVELLNKNPNDSYGRAPRVLVMTPTRELARQVADHIAVLSGDLQVSTVYGGTAYGPQLRECRQGIDILVGTPGRINDLCKQDYLNLSQLQHIVLDEVDTMLDMGFADAVEEIIKPAYRQGSRPQTLLYSATMPDWVLKIAKKYMNRNYKKINLVGDKRTVKTAITVDHLAIACDESSREAVIAQLIHQHEGEQVIVFCETKYMTQNMGASLSRMNLRVGMLHGDMSQNQREQVMTSFRRGNLSVLVATNVAARGLDLPNVDLVILAQPPNDIDNYIHRSGRTGRAGKSGTAICLYEDAERSKMKQVEKVTNLRFKWEDAPELTGLPKPDFGPQINQVKDEEVERFTEDAESLIKEKGAVPALSAALALLASSKQALGGVKRFGSSGNYGPQRTNSNNQNLVKFLLRSQETIPDKRYVYETLQPVRAEMQYLKLSEDRKAAVFELPVDVVQTVEENWVDTEDKTLQKVIPGMQLPRLEQRSFQGARHSGGNRDFVSFNTRDRRSFQRRGHDNRNSDRRHSRYSDDFSHDDF